jgi:transcription-repair coupling factor (superfamily II helicase)
MYDRPFHIVRDSEPLLELLDAVRRAEPAQAVPVTGIPGSLAALVLAAVRERTGRTMLVVMGDREGAERMRDDLRLFLPPAEIRLFASPATRQHAHQRPAEDVETLRALLAHDAGIIVTHPEGLLVRLPEAVVLNRRMLLLRRDEEAGFELVLEAIAGLGFERTTFVSSPGEFAVRGGILDVYPFVGEHPVRCEFSGDTIESLREFDPLSQRSIKELSSATIVPDLLAGTADTPGAASSLVRFFDGDALVVLEDPALIRAGLDAAAGQGRGELHTAESVRADLLDARGGLHLFRLEGAGAGAIDFGAVAQPAFNGNTRLLRRTLVALQKEGFRIVLAGEAQPELTRLKDLLAAQEEPGAEGGDEEPQVDIGQLTLTHPAVASGFRCDRLQLALFTEHQIFNRQKRRSSAPRGRFRGFTDKELRQLRKGDYVVHADYGIGRFQGLQRIRVSTVEQEVLRLSYEDNDILYVNLNYVNRVQKYSSKEGHAPRLTKLGRAEWDRLKDRARKRIQDIARDLIRLYAERKSSQGFACAPDAPWQKELEASFIYEDTFDQARTTREVKQDMEASFPMDRLVCGDVGFGKTEIAVRAAFKAVMNGKQVALLVPTTILALQHYHTFGDRLAPYGTNIQVLSRFKSKSEQLAILDLAKAGTADIVIGTHRLLQKDVGFRDIGLLIIDEEHRFGVAAKEKLRKLKTSVDTLTLTATPIPRTLHFSLMGARDLSVIATPPRNRLPVITEITQESGDLIREAVLREVQREGQVYVVHDRVQDIEQVAARLRELVPGVGVRCAHGQMHAHELEDVMVAFLEKRFGVLVCTKIIESGLDIPNVNTIIINRADRFGMAELYQLRGRVGRSNIQAYAHLLTPPVETLARATLQRLQALEEFTELGAGFHLAMRDLEIRGAGNLLGAEQSGFIESMGFETYTRILEEAVTELKDQEFRNLFPDEGRGPKRMDTVVDMEFPALLPVSYVEQDTERLELYRRLYSLDSLPQLEELHVELRDRFGVLPGEAEHLLSAVRVRLTVGAWGFPKVAISLEGAEMEFPPQTMSSFYESVAFQEMMGRIGRMREKGVALKTVGKSLKLTVRFSRGVQDPASEFLSLLGGILPPGSPTGGVALPPV